MYKAIFSIFLAATVLLLISSHQTFASMPAPARQAGSGPVPERIVHDGGTLRPADLGVSKVTWTVWNSNDAASRIRNATLAAAARRDPAVAHIGINTDPSAELHRALLRRDGLEHDSLQLHISP